ncbi:PREDICTED: putative hydroxypyruvate isomerase [Nanorana parkeri]|uniref:putative hydroxypyruvate isomerase n=1 Tax=Nanorana parkeri TaxID=125878 RepID=UPI0008541A0C|nr:PREDICTED: putative hydroxypyruvate isomerase [Nanorana parkeri]
MEDAEGHTTAEGKGGRAVLSGCNVQTPADYPSSPRSIPRSRASVMGLEEVINGLRQEDEFGNTCRSAMHAGTGSPEEGDPLSEEAASPPHVRNHPPPARPGCEPEDLIMSYLLCTVFYSASFFYFQRKAAACVSRMQLTGSLCVGDTQAGELGLGAVPGRQDAFRAGLERAVRLATDLECQRIHIMAGRAPGGRDRGSAEKEMEETFVENLRYAADMLDQVGMVGLIEPINCRLTEPRYFLNTPQQAAAILQKVGRENLKMQMKRFYFLRSPMDGRRIWHMPGLLSSALRGAGFCGLTATNSASYRPLSSGHVQIAQVPHRHEPDSPGELNFPYLFDLLEELGYQGYVGCEYKPCGDTLAGLGWMEEYHKRREERGEPN